MWGTILELKYSLVESVEGGRDEFHNSFAAFSSKDVRMLLSRLAGWFLSSMPRPSAKRVFPAKRLEMVILGGEVSNNQRLSQIDSTLGGLPCWNHYPIRNNSIPNLKYRVARFTFSYRLDFWPFPSKTQIYIIGSFFTFCLKKNQYFQSLHYIQIILTSQRCHWLLKPHIFGSLWVS